MLDDADRACPSCGGALRPITGRFEESELIAVIEVRYEFVKVKQQKYGSRYSLAFAIKIVLDK